MQSRTITSPRANHSSDQSLQLSDIFITTSRPYNEDDDDDTLDDSHTTFSSSTFRRRLHNTWKRNRPPIGQWTTRLASITAEQHRKTRANTTSTMSSMASSLLLQPKQQQYTKEQMDRLWRLQQRNRQQSSNSMQQGQFSSHSHSTPLLLHGMTGLLWITTLFVALYPSLLLGLLHTYVIPIPAQYASILSYMSIFGLSVLPHARWNAWAWMVLIQDGFVVGQLLLLSPQSQVYWHHRIRHGMYLLSGVLSVSSLLYAFCAMQVRPMVTTWLCQKLASSWCTPPPASNSAWIDMACETARTLFIYTSVFMGLLVLLLYLCVGQSKRSKQQR